jgi:hypothetical protein
MKTYVIEEQGYFWWNEELIPEGHYAPESSVTGVLKIDVEGRIELDLNGVLSSGDFPFGALLNNDQKIPNEVVIQGILKSTSKYALLSGVIKNGGRFQSNGISFESYLAINCLVGKGPFPKTKEPLQFHRLKVELTGFEDWLRIGSIEFDRKESSIYAKYEAPKDITYPLDDGTLSIEFDILGPHFGVKKLHNLTLTESASIRYTPESSASLEDMKTQYGLVEDLFILLTDSDYCLDWPSVYLGQEMKPCQFYFLRHHSSAAAPDSHECWTNFVQLRESFGQIFSTWRKKHEEFGPGFYLYLGTRRGIKLYEEHRFVNLIWGVESLHRKKAPEPSAPSKLKKKIVRILDQVKNSRDKKWLERRLNHADEPTLEQRMYETFKSLPLGLDDQELRQFCSDCAKDRNDISHFGGLRDEGDYGEFVLSLSKKSAALSYLYHALLLQEIGVVGSILNWYVNEGFRSYTIKSALADVGLLSIRTNKQVSSEINNGTSHVGSADKLPTRDLD